MIKYETRYYWNGIDVTWQIMNKVNLPWKMNLKYCEIKAIDVPVFDKTK